KLRQILINLLGNALKFTQAGEVKLQAHTLAPSGNGAKQGDINGSNNLTCINFIVQDTGPGIAEQDLNLIFDAFGQSEAGIQSQEGTGLGLTICRQFVSLMGGDISVDSEIGVGSTFKFFIKVAQVTKAEYEALIPTTRIIGLAADQAAPKILIVEDKAANRQLVSEFLQTMGFKVQEAVNGKEAIALWEDWQPHLILMDIRMPVMDGYEATREIRRIAQDSSPIIIALTANAFEEDRQIALKAGCDGFVRKPYEEQKLLETIGKHLGLCYRDQDGHEIVMAPESGEHVHVNVDGLEISPTEPAIPLNILVAEDDAQNRVFMEEMLTHLGYHATLVQDGAEAIKAFAKQSYDLLMCDVHMPNVTGIELARLVRQHKLTSQPMIVGVTGSTMGEELEECYQAGMDKILMKPVKFQEIESLLESLQQAKKMSAVSENDELSMTLSSERSGLKSALEEGSIVDCVEQPESELTPATLDRQYFFENYQKAFGKDAPGKIVVKVESFLAELPDRLEALQSMISEGNHGQVSFIGHNLKSVVKTFGAVELAEICEAIENEAHESPSPDYQALLNQLGLESERFKLALSLELQHYRGNAEDDQLSVAGAPSL
ncbi:MAG: response regulator, partial [Cyanobacteria bacterium J06632_3]